MSSPPSTHISGHVRRPSKFIEGNPLTRPDLLRRPTALNDILTEMDKFEKQRQHRDSSSSVESLGTPLPAPIMGKPEKRRSFGIGRPSLGDMDRSQLKNIDERLSREERLVEKVKGRLRALTGSRREDKISSYPGT